MLYIFDSVPSLREISRKVALILRLRAFDTSTHAGRSQERYRRVALTALSSGVAKCISILTGLITVPLTLNYLGAEQYGVWMTLSSVVLMIGFADLGMGNGLLNVIAGANGRDDREEAINYVSSGFFMLFGLALLIMLLFTIAYPHIPWSILLNNKTELAAQEAGPAMAVMVAMFALNLPLGVVQRVQMGYQEGYKANIYQCLGSILALIAVLLVIHVRGRLAWLMLAVSGGPLLALMLNWVILFRFQSPWLRPRWHNATASSSNKIFRLGFQFFILQLSVALAWASDNLVTAQILGPEAVAQYSVPMRLFSVLPMVMSMIIAPLWPAYGEAIARGEMGWIRKTLTWSLFLTFLMVALPSVLFVLFGVQIVHFWVGPVITPSFLLLVGMGVWTILLSLGNTLSMFLNGANLIKFQIFCASLAGIGALLAKIFLAKIIGLPGIIWGTVIGCICFVVIPTIIYLPKVFSTLHSRQTGNEHL